MTKLFTGTAPHRVRLGVNIDHVATIRNARGGAHPSPLAAALQAEAEEHDAALQQAATEQRAALLAADEAIEAAALEADRGPARAHR